MSTAPASSHQTASGAGHAAAARGAHAAARKPGAHGANGGSDHFSMLLSLLSASDASGLPALMGSGDAGGTSAATDALAADPNAAMAADGSPLAAVMQWMDLPQGNGAKRSTSTSGADADAGLAAIAGRTDQGVTAKDPLNGLTAGQEVAGTGGNGRGEALPAGMQRLAQPETPDAKTLAALTGATPGLAVETATPDQTAAASLANATSPLGAAAQHPGTASARPGPHAPAGAHATPGAAASTQALQQGPVSVQIERLPSRNDAMVLAGTRSTVTLDERFSPTAPSGEALGSSALGSTAASATASTGAGSSGGDLSGQGGQGGHDTSAAASSSGNDSGQSSSDPDDRALWAAEERAMNEERLDAFTAPTLHEAKLRVGDDGSDAIDIRLSLSGQELDLGFRTDSAEARAALADDALGSLSERLQRSGIQLGDVSVGAQNGQTSGGEARQQAAARPTISGAGRIERSSAASTDTPIMALRPRTDGNRPLDTFA